MRRQDFGKIVASLRKEQVDFTSGRSWTQAQLAEATGLTRKIVSKIEQGAQARLGREVLCALADAFHLTTLERREFFAAASEVTDAEIVRSNQCAQTILGQIWAMLESVRLPAYLFDPFGDVLGVNPALLAFHNLSLPDLKAARSTDLGVNVLAQIFDPEGPLRRVLGAHWSAIALSNLQQWRAMTLRYRHTPRFQQLFAALSCYPDFDRLWAVSRNIPDDQHSRLRHFIYDHDIHG
jgi:transcriptional regulator with XRE-family HTH domain